MIWEHAVVTLLINQNGNARIDLMLAFGQLALICAVGLLTHGISYQGFCHNDLLIPTGFSGVNRTSSVWRGTSRKSATCLERHY